MVVEEDKERRLSASSKRSQQDSGMSSSDASTHTLPPFPPRTPSFFRLWAARFRMTRSPLTPVPLSLAYSTALHPAAVRLTDLSTLLRNRPTPNAGAFTSKKINERKKKTSKLTEPLSAVRSSLGEHCYRLAKRGTRVDTTPRPTGHVQVEGEEKKLDIEDMDRSRARNKRLRLFDLDRSGSSRGS